MGKETNAGESTVIFAGEMRTGKVERKGFPWGRAGRGGPVCRDGSGLGVEVREGGVAGKVKTGLETEGGLVRIFESRVQEGTWIS